MSFLLRIVKQNHNAIAILVKEIIIFFSVTPLNLKDEIVARIEERIAKWTLLPEGIYFRLSIIYAMFDCSEFVPS